MQRLLLSIGIGLILLTTNTVQAASYAIDTEGAHAFIQFKIKHLGYSWLLGRFNTFEGDFYYDPADPKESSIDIEIETASVDSNHAERDKHLREEDFLNVKKYPTATFNSTGFKPTADGEGVLSGDFTLHGVTKNISFPVKLVGEGDDPWGGYRAGFAGTTKLKLSDYGITYDLGPASTHVEIELYIEGIKE